MNKLWTNIKAGFEHTTFGFQGRHDDHLTTKWGWEKINLFLPLITRHGYKQIFAKFVLFGEKKNISGAKHQSMTKSGNVLFFQKMVDFFQRPKNELMIVSLFDCLTPGLKQWAINYGTIKALDCISIETHGQAQTLLRCHHVTEKFSSRKFQFFFQGKNDKRTKGA